MKAIWSVTSGSCRLCEGQTRPGVLSVAILAVTVLVTCSILSNG
jgi:hypothetical protein